MKKHLILCGPQASGKTYLSGIIAALYSWNGTAQIFGYNPEQMPDFEYLKAFNIPCAVVDEITDPEQIPAIVFSASAAGAGNVIWIFCIQSDTLDYSETIPEILFNIFTLPALPQPEQIEN